MKENIKTYYWGPAHTNGDSIIFFPHANIAHVGDLVFNRRWAFIDRSAGASIKNWIVVLDKIQQEFDNDTLFVFGHAFDPEKVTGNKADLKAMQDYLKNLLAFVNSQIKAGKTKDEIMKATSIPGVTEWQGDGIERGLQAAYEEEIEGIIVSFSRSPSITETTIGQKLLFFMSKCGLLQNDIFISIREIFCSRKVCLHI